MATVTCHTPDCANQGVPLEMNLTYEDEDGNTQAITSVYCGPCGQPITDIDDGTEPEVNPQ